MSNQLIKKVYCYVICLISLLLLLWGTVDIISAGFNLMSIKPQQAPAYEMMPTEGSPFPGGEMKGLEPSIEDYYQKRMALDRIGNSSSRIIIAGIVFGFFSLKLKKMEKASA